MGKTKLVDKPPPPFTPLHTKVVFVMSKSKCLYPGWQVQWVKLKYVASCEEEGGKKNKRERERRVKGRKTY